MRAIVVLVVLAVLLVAGLSTATMPWGEKKITSSGGINISGATHAAVVADGDAQVQFFAGGWRRPNHAGGDTVYTLGESLPREFSSPVGIDSVYVLMGTATGVVVTWGSW